MDHYVVPMTHATVLYQDGRLTVTPSAVDTPTGSYPVTDLETLSLVPRPAEPATGNRFLLGSAALSMCFLAVVVFALGAGPRAPMWLMWFCFGAALLPPVVALIYGRARRVETFDVEAGHRGRDVVLARGLDRPTAMGIGTAVVAAMRISADN
jgi:hypothetical protein